MKYDFMIFEDRKFADIGNTVEQQYNTLAKNYKRLDLVTVLPIFGDGTIKAIGKCSNFQVGQFIVRQGSTSDNLFTEDYFNKCVEMCENDKTAVVTGFICQKRLETDSERFIYATPGVSLSQKSDGKNQQYRSVSDALIRDNCDAIIVGRGITGAQDPEAMAKMYSEEAYKCYQNKLLV